MAIAYDFYSLDSKRYRFFYFDSLFNRINSNNINFTLSNGTKYINKKMDKDNETWDNINKWSDYFMIEIRNSDNVKGLIMFETKKERMKFIMKYYKKLEKI
mmetsp:Transcript_43668/g.56005  ORF Transcript_43668/g.56005 Transcript_43668/m.56005 type:complete len:101 (+) Transcript_43668:62-364(+)